jgi:hypothetical protein
MELPTAYDVLAFVLVARFFFHLAVFICGMLHAHFLSRIFRKRENFGKKYGEWAGKALFFLIKSKNILLEIF